MVKVPARRTRRVLRSGPAGAALQSGVVAPADDPRQSSLFSDPMPNRIERGGHDWTARFPSIARDALALTAPSSTASGRPMRRSCGGPR